MEMKLDFKTPMAMSGGAFNDQIKISIKTPEYFASKHTGLTLEAGDIDSTASVPSQLPHGVVEEDLRRSS